MKLAILDYTSFNKGISIFYINLITKDEHRFGKSGDFHRYYPNSDIPRFIL